MVSNQYRGGSDAMCGAVYNAGIPDITSNPVHGSFARIRFLLTISIFLVFFVIRARAADWNGSEQELARKIVAVTGPGAVALTFQNRSSLSTRDVDVVENGLRSALASLGVRLVDDRQAAASVEISLSENPAAYVWVAEIQQSAGESAVVMASALRPAGLPIAPDSLPMSLRKTLLWRQSEPILDVAVLEEGETPTHIAVLDPEKISLYGLRGGKWQQDAALANAHNRPWPRDLRGRLLPGRDYGLDAYLPGAICSMTAGTPVKLNCRESDDPWPLLPAGSANGVPGFPEQMKAFFAPTRNFFTGVLTPGIGKVTAVPKFYSAAFLPREKYTLWLFAATDGQVRMIDGLNQQVMNSGWGSDLAVVKTPCGAGWQVLASNTGETADDSVRAYEFPDREPVAVSAAVELPGAIKALWTEARGDTAVVVTRNQETGSYEAFRLAMACGQ